MTEKTAVIIGAGPAGLTAAYELLDKTDIKPVIYEASDIVGGISRTVDYRGNRMDIGGHRFFSKSDRVMEWWLNILPPQGAPARGESADKKNAEYPGYAWRREIGSGERERIPAPDPEVSDDVMLMRSRLSRILFEGKLYSYPVSLGMDTLANLGISRTLKVGGSYARARLFPIREERSLEDFLINRFGRELYETFFRDYTEKVWGVPCADISPEWGAQRIKGLSVSRALLHALRGLLTRDNSMEQKETETSLIERFMYPKYGPGQLWEKVADTIRSSGGEINLGHRVVALERDEGRITGLLVRSDSSGDPFIRGGDYFLSSMPVADLIEALGEGVPREVASVAEGLVYRNFIAVGLLLERLRLDIARGRGEAGGGVNDNWIYVQEKDLKVSRMQIFNNWSPYLVRDVDKVWVGLEYICGGDDAVWRMDDGEILELARCEMARMGAAEPGDIIDGTVVKMDKVYPAYFGTYDRFDTIREFTDGIDNLYLIGRNGMHRYNNQDHSMLTAMTAVENIAAGVREKDNIWAVNVEGEYLETR